MAQINLQIDTFWEHILAKVNLEKKIEEAQERQKKISEEKSM